MCTKIKSYLKHVYFVLILLAVLEPRFLAAGAALCTPTYVGTCSPCFSCSDHHHHLMSRNVHPHSDRWSKNVNGWRVDASLFHMWPSHRHRSWPASSARWWTTRQVQFWLPSALYQLEGLLPCKPWPSYHLSWAVQVEELRHISSFCHGLG